MIYTISSIFGGPAYAEYASLDEIRSALTDLGAEPTDLELFQFSEGELQYNSLSGKFEEQA